MARPLTPTASLEAKGSFLRHPERKRARSNEPCPTGELGPPPHDLGKDEKEAWTELEAIIPPGVAKNCERWLVEEAACLKAEARRYRKTGQQWPKGRLDSLTNMLAKLGLTPVDRPKVHVEKQTQKADDPWSRLMAKPQ